MAMRTATNLMSTNNSNNIQQQRQRTMNNTQYCGNNVDRVVRSVANSQHVANSHSHTKHVYDNKEIMEHNSNNTSTVRITCTTHIYVRETDRGRERDRLSVSRQLTVLFNIRFRVYVFAYASVCICMENGWIEFRWTVLAPQPLSFTALLCFFPF